MTRATSEDFAIAIEWLESNNGTAGEADACRRVAVMLRSKLTTRKENAIVRAVARRSRAPESAVRNFLKSKGAI